MKDTAENTKESVRKESGKKDQEIRKKGGKMARWRKAIILLLLAYCS